MSQVEEPQRVAKRSKPKSTDTAESREPSTPEAQAAPSRQNFWEVYGYGADAQKRIAHQIANQFRKLDTDRL